MGAKKGYFYIVVTIIMFTSYEVVLKFISGQLNSMQLTLCRFSVGFLILLPLALHTLKKRGERLDGKSIAYFALLGLLVIVLFYRSAKEHQDRAFRWMWLTIVLSFGFYIPVVLWADTIPMIGMLMIPKTCAYVWTVLIGYFAMKRECR